MAQEVEKKPVPRAKPKAPAQKVIDRAIDEALYEVGRTKFTCNMCGKLKDASDFYKSTDPLCTTGVTRISEEAQLEALPSLHYRPVLAAITTLYGRCLV